MARIVQVAAAELEVARNVLREYQASLKDPGWFQNFDRDLLAAGVVWAPPDGALLLAWEGTEPAACGALRRVDARIAQMENVFVRPRFRGKGLARSVSIQLLGEARRLGYELVRLETLPSMTEASGLYRSVGFLEIPAYPGCRPHAICMEARVRAAR